MISLGAYEYNPANVLGNGAFAIVYKGRMKNNPDEPVAIKIMLKDRNVLKSKTLLSKEISVLKDLNHDNIVRLYDHSVSSAGVYLVMEYCNGGDLSEYLQVKRTLPEETIRHFLVQIGSAMDAMNRKGFMHRDLKPGNILLSHCRDCGQNVTDIPGRLLLFKLADFGFARFLQDGMMAVTMCGSPMYMAPEVLMSCKYDAVADIWSMGIIVYQCLTGKAPFYANTPEALKNIYEKTACLKPKIPVTTSKALRDLLLQMLVRKPSDRIDFQNFLNHPFLHQRHFEPQAPNLTGPSSRTGTQPTPGTAAPNLPNRTGRPEIRGSGITVLGHGTGDGPYYLPARDPNRTRDKTPQGNILNPRNPIQPNSNLQDGPNNLRPWTEPSIWPPNTNQSVKPRPSDYNPYQLNNLTPGLNEFEDELDDEMTRTTVDEYIEDDLDGSNLGLEPLSSPGQHDRHLVVDQRYVPELPTPSLVHNHNNNGNNNTPIQTAYYRNTPNSLDVRLTMNRDSHLNRGATTTGGPNTRFDLRNPVPVNNSPNTDPNELPLDDYVIVNSDGSVQHLDRKQNMGDHHLPMSNISRIVHNPTVNLRNILRRAPPDVAPLPDVTVVGSGSTTDAYGRRIPDPANVHQIHPTNEPTHFNTKLTNYPVAEARVSPSGQKQSGPIYEPSKDTDDRLRIDQFKQNRDVIPVNRTPTVGLPNKDTVRWTQPSGTDVTLLGPVNGARFPYVPPTPGQGLPQVAQNTQTAHLLARERRSLTNPGDFAIRYDHDYHRPHSGAGLLEYAAGNLANELISGGLWEAAEFSDELIMEPEHNEEIQKITMVLELCELLSELAERRASAMANCTASTTSQSNESDKNSEHTDQNHASNGEKSVKSSPAKESQSTKQSPQMITGLKFVSEAQRIVEQIVLYRRVLYYLEYVFAQVKKAFQSGRLKSTGTARRRLVDCNALYHRCYIRLRQLARQSRREDLIEPVGRLLSNITANRLIFQYALDQCYAAEMDEYIGEIALSLQRYKAGITLIHGLCQHAKSSRDKSLLADCMRLLRDRYASLWATATKQSPPNDELRPNGMVKLGSSPISNPSPNMPSNSSPILENPSSNDRPQAPNYGLNGQHTGGDGHLLTSSPMR